MRRPAPAERRCHTAHYTVDGKLFFASSNDLTTKFEYTDEPDRIVIDMSTSHIGDASTVAALDAISTTYEHHGKRVVCEGLNEASTIALNTRR